MKAASALRHDVATRLNITCSLAEKLRIEISTCYFFVLKLYSFVFSCGHCHYAHTDTKLLQHYTVCLNDDRGCLDHVTFLYE